MISVTGHGVIGGIYNYLLSLPTLYSLCLQQGPYGMIQRVIPEESGPLVFLPRLCYYSFQLTLITGHGNTNRYPKGSHMFWTLFLTSAAE